MLVRVAAIAGACALVAACSDSGTDTNGSEAGSPTSTTAVALPPAPWTAFGFDNTNSRFNPTESQIKPHNVGTLSETWRLELGTGMSATPMVVDGIAYIADWSGNAHAVDVSDGSILWTTEVAGTIMASVTVRDDAVFVASSRNLFRLDRATGEQQWEASVSDHPLAIAPSAPVLAGDLVLQGTASGELMLGMDEYRFRGSVAAFDAETGDEQWRLWMTEADETGGAGVGIWSTPSVDLDLGLGFVGTGNTYQPPASPRANSILAFELATGDVAWSRQFTEGDVWSMGNIGGVDGDVGAGPNLWESGGRALVGAGDKRGTYYALDRATGEIVWETTLTPGSLLGGVIGTSALGEGRLYIASNIGNPDNNAPTSTATVLALDVDNGDVLWRTDLDGAVFAPVSATPGLVYVGTTAGNLHVLDAATGVGLWSMAVPDQVGAGASVVDGVVYWGYGFALLGAGSGEGALMALMPDPDAAPAPAISDGEDESLGASVFRMSCSSCHGLRGQGAIGPDLVGIADRMTVAEHEEIVREGKPPHMPGFATTLSDEEIDAVVEFERNLTDN